MSDRVGALRTAEWRKPRKPSAGATVAEPEIRRFRQQAEVEHRAGCENRVARRLPQPAKRERRMVESGNNINNKEPKP